MSIHIKWAIVWLAALPATALAQSRAWTESQVSESCRKNVFACSPLEGAHHDRLRGMDAEARIVMYQEVASAFVTSPGTLMALCEYRIAEGIANEHRCATYWARTIATSIDDERATLTRILGRAKATVVIDRALELAYAYWPGSPIGSASPDPVDPILVSPDGHFYARPVLNGVPILMMVDTGASVVVLSSRDASSAGLDPSALSYDATLQTAAGPQQFARAWLENFEFEGLWLKDIEVLVAPAGVEFGISLLGMSVLRHFSKVEVSANRMILRR